MDVSHVETAALEAFLPDRRRTGEEVWHVLHVMSRQEKALDRELTGRGIDCYVPILREAAYQGRRKKLVSRPMFPGYAFLWGTVDEAYEADRTRRVANIIRVTDQEELERELTNIERALRLDAPLKPVRSYRPGTRVRVTSGPFRGIEGVVNRYASGTRLILRVSMLGNAVSLEVEESLLVAV